MATNNIKTLEHARLDLSKCIDGYNTALQKKDFEGMTKSQEDIKEAEAVYAEVAANQVYLELEVKGNPFATIKNAIARHTYVVLRARDVKTDDRIVGKELVEKERQIDILKMCNRLDLPITFELYIEKFNQLMTIRAAQELKIPTKDIATSYYMKEAARQIELGETPTSNNKICAQLQTVIDKILFEDDGNGKNTYKANNHDVAYILALYTKKGKAALSVTTAKHSFLRLIITDVIYRIMTNSKYGIDFKKVKEKK